MTVVGPDTFTVEVLPDLITNTLEAINIPH